MTKLRAQFFTSAAQPSDFPPPTLPEVAVVGRSNVGKSSLINALVGQTGLARTSRTPGRTRLVNWFAIEDRFYLVDLPGYGYAEVSHATREGWRPLIEGYLADRASQWVLNLTPSQARRKSGMASSKFWLRHLSQHIWQPT